MNRLLLLGVTIIATASCATKPVAHNEARAAPPERTFAFQQLSAGTAKLVIARDKGVSGAVCAFNVYVNGQRTAELRSGEYVELNVPTGNTIVGAAPTGGIRCGSPEAHRRETSLIVAPDGQSKVRVSFTPMGGIGVTPTAF